MIPHAEMERRGDYVVGWRHMTYNLRMSTVRNKAQARAIVVIIAVAVLAMGAIVMATSMSACGNAQTAQSQHATSTTSSPTDSDAKMLVCIGDSITYGMGVAEPQRDAWPALLQSKLGGDWSVVNLGVSGTTLLDEGLHPYRETGNIARACALNADMAIIMLGTNDTVDPAWSAEAYRIQLDALATELVDASTHEIQLVFMIPPHAFFGSGETPQRQAMNQLIGGEMRSIITDVAAKHDAQLIDLFTFTEGRHEWFPDDLHPNEVANAAMADYIYAQIFE